MNILNCNTCKYKQDPLSEGHCYMFFEEPKTTCMQYQGSVSDKFIEAIDKLFVGVKLDMEI